MLFGMRFRRQDAAAKVNDPFWHEIEGTPLDEVHRIQEERLRERLEDPLKRWKLSPIDLAARGRYDAYTDAREAMLEATHTAHAPWTLVDFNDQKCGRLTLLRDLLDRLPDMHVDPPAIDFPELAREPAKESYSVLKPIAPYPLD